MPLCMRPSTRDAIAVLCMLATTPGWRRRVPSDLSVAVFCDSLLLHILFYVYSSTSTLLRLLFYPFPAQRLAKVVENNFFLGSRLVMFGYRRFAARFNCRDHIGNRC